MKDFRRNHYAKKLVATEGDCHGRWRIVKELLHLGKRPDTKDELKNHKRIIQCWMTTTDSSRNDREDRGEYKKHHQLWISTSTNRPRLQYAIQFSTVRQHNDGKVQAIKNIPPRTSPFHTIIAMILKNCSKVFGPLISTLANLSLFEERFPGVFKFGHVTQLPKKPGTDDKDMDSFGI